MSSTKKVWVVLNVSLGLLAVLLLLNLFEVQLPTLGRAFNLLDKEEPWCVVQWKEDYSELDLQSCCSEARKQLSCEPQKGVFVKEVDWLCSTGPHLKYRLNNKAYYQCTQLGI